MVRTLHLGLLATPALSSVLKRADPSAALWQPAVGAQWQIVINNNVSVDPFKGSIPSSPDIWDIDLFNTPKDVFDTLHEQGKKIICYFSAGTGEDWRPDYSQFAPADLGDKLGCWPGERYLNLKSEGVWNIMAARIKLANDKGCDGIDPDNMDGYSNANGFGLTTTDSTNFLKRMAAEAKKYGMSTGLKNALEILPAVLGDIQYAVNEECQGGADCTSYRPLLSAGKPVFHIEYVTHSVTDGQVILKSELDGLQGASTETIRSVLCVEKNLQKMVANGTVSHPAIVDGDAASAKQYSTVIKGLLLDGWVYYCDASSYTTPEFNVGTGGPSDGYCGSSKKARLQKAKALGHGGL